MSKIHLRRNKNVEIANIAACATNPYVAKASRNQRSTYQMMASEIVPWEEFRNISALDRCVHCVEAALVIRNRQRKVKGMSPIKDAFEK